VNLSLKDVESLICIERKILRFKKLMMYGLLYYPSRLLCQKIEHLTWREVLYTQVAP